MSSHSKNLELLLHSLAFKLAQEDDEDEWNFLMDVWESAMEARQEYLDEIKRLQDDGKPARIFFKPQDMSEAEKAERRMERILRNSKWN